MPYKLTRNANHTIEIDAHLGSEDVDRERQVILASVRRKAQIPGFRPGKAPRAAVQVRYAEEIREELQDHLSSLLWQEVLDGEDELQPLTRPQIENMSFADDGGFGFVATMEVRPDYDLPDVEGLTLDEHSLDVEPVDVEAELAKIQEEKASWEPADDAEAEDGMMVEADLHGELEDSDEEIYDEENAQFVIGSGSAPDEINEAVQGAKVGDQRVAEKRFPDDDENEKRAGKKVTYKVTIKGLKRKVLPEIDDDLAIALGMETLDELKERISTVLGQRKRADRRDAWRRQVLDHLQTGIDVNELPPSMVQAAVSEDLNQLAYAMAMRGVSPEDADIDWQEMSVRAEPEARRKVLDTLVLEHLAEEWNIEVPENEVDAHLAMEAQRSNVPAAEHKANLAKDGKLDQVRHAARIAATVDELIRRAGGEVD